MDNDRLAFASWLLDRNLAWIAAADAKVAVVTAIDVAMLAGLAAAASTSSSNGFAEIIAALAAAMLAAAIAFAGIAVFPRTTGPNMSLIFFGCISKQTAAAFRDQFKNSSNDDMLDDCLAQVHRNAEIAAEKHKWVGKAVRYSFIGAIPWIMSIVLSVSR